MPGPILTVASVATCPHGASVSIAPGEARVLLSGQPAATMADTYTVIGCPFEVPDGARKKLRPCVTLRFVTSATRVMAGGKPVILATSIGLCLSADQMPAGPPTVTFVQPRVIAT